MYIKEGDSFSFHLFYKGTKRQKMLKKITLRSCCHSPPSPARAPCRPSPSRSPRPRRSTARAWPAGRSPSPWRGPAFDSGSGPDDCSASGGGRRRGRAARGLPSSLVLLPLLPTPLTTASKVPPPSPPLLSLLLLLLPRGSACRRARGCPAGRGTRAPLRARGRRRQ